MKRVVFLFTCIFFSMTLLGCVSDAQYEELEKRVAYLEEVNGLTNNNELKKNDSNNSDMIVDVDNNGESTSNEDTNSVDNSSDNYNYYIDSMSSSEVVDEYMYYLENLPSVGETYEQVLSRIKVHPISEDKSYLSFQFCKNNSMPPMNDVIASLGYSGVYMRTEMDGSAGVQFQGDHEPEGVSMTILVTDYDRAEDLFNEFYSTLGANLREVSKSQEGTMWKASHYVIQYSNAEHSSWGEWKEDFLKMEKSDDYYKIYVTIHLYRDYM